MLLQPLSSRSATAQPLLSKKRRAFARLFITNMVGDRRIELLTSSVSRKRSTSELIAQRDEILLANVRPVNSLSGFGALPSQGLIEILTSTYVRSRWK